MAIESKNIRGVNTRERIISLIEDNEESYRAFEEKFGLKKGTVSEWKRNKMFNYMDYLVEIADEYDTTTDWLLGRVEDDTPEFKYVFISKWVSYGQLIKEYENSFEHIKVPTEVCPTGELFGVRVIGDSFMPVAVDGDILVCNRITAKANGKMCVATIEGETFICRVKIDSEWVTMIPTNPMNKEIRISRANVDKFGFRIDGVIVQSIRDFK